jgi:signal transduction histidine kinase/CheY-like chemotaxis protein
MIARTIAATVILLMILTWLWWRAIHTGTGATDQALRALDDFAIAESALHRDVLRARTGMLRNYDPLVREISALRGSADRLRKSTARDPEAATFGDRLADLVDRQERATEEFKSNNALLQNSLAYFGLLSAHLDEANDSTGRIQQIGAMFRSLATAMLHLTLDTSPNVVAEVDDRLSSISAQGLSPGDSDVVGALLAHAQLLRRLLPETDNVLKSLFAVSGDREQEAFRALILARKNAAETRAERTRYVLCAVSLLLVGTLVYFWIGLQKHALTLRRRAKIEHLIARISTRFINTRADELTARIEHALAELAACIGADRAYFVIDGTPEQAYTWCSKATSFPQGWPSDAIALASHLGASQGAIQIHDVARLPPGRERDALSTANVHGWLAFPRSGAQQRAQGVLGFDAVRASAATRLGELGLLRMASDAIANAVDRDRLEHDRERLEANLQQARRMETVGALAIGIAHNFNNITGAILGHAETAQGQVEPHSRAAGNLNEIRRAGERARDLVAQILTFGRSSTVRRGSISLQTLIAETKSLLDGSLPPHVKILVHATSQATTVSGEPAQLQQVILNVCNNAAQAMDAAGTIDIEIDARQIGGAVRVGHGELLPGHYVVMSITDPGRGMDEAMLERIFEPFFTTRLEGNGLGLATVREIVLDHGGAVKVQSAPGAGTRFDIWLPSVSAAESPSSHEPAGSAPRGSGETVLVLEPDRERLLRHEEILAALGYEPVGFTHPADAAAACREAPARFDAALVCFHLHGAGTTLDHAAAFRARWAASWGQPPEVGTALNHAAVLRENAPGLPVILATASAREFGALSLAGVGISEVIRQPLMTAELAGALARCLSVPVSTSRHLRAVATGNAVASSAGYGRNAYRRHETSM